MRSRHLGEQAVGSHFLDVATETIATAERDDEAAGVRRRGPIEGLACDER